jgi:hypothetical protein
MADTDVAVGLDEAEGELVGEGVETGDVMLEMRRFDIFGKTALV